MLVGSMLVEDCSELGQNLWVDALLVADDNDRVVEERLPERLLVFLGKLVEVEDRSFVWKVDFGTDHGLAALVLRQEGGGER